MSFSYTQNTLDETKPNLVMLASHPPQVDPRIDWSIELILEYFNTTYFGLGKLPERAEAWDFDYNVEMHEGLTYKQLTDKKVFLKQLRAVGSQLSLSQWMSIVPIVLAVAVEFVIPTNLFFFTFQSNSSVIKKGFWHVKRFVFKRTEKLLLRGLKKVYNWDERKLAKKKEKQEAERLKQEQSNKKMKAQFDKKRAKYKKAPYKGLPIFFWMLGHFKRTCLSGWQFLNEHAASSPVDVVYCNDLDMLLPCVMFKLKTGSKLIYDAHEYWAQSYLGASWYFVKLFTWLESTLLPFTDYALTVTEPLAEIMKTDFGYDDIHVLPNCEHWKSHSALSDHYPTLDSMAQGRIKFLFQGWISYDRGVEELIEAFKSIDPDKAALFIRSPECDLKEDIKTMADEYGLLDNSVFFPEPVNEEELIPSALQADVGVIPYKPSLIPYKYGCPNKLSQYMHAGLAILSNENVFVSRIVEAQDCGRIYTTSNLDTLVQGFQQFIDNPQWLEQCKQNALRYGQAEYNYAFQSRPLRQVLAQYAQESTTHSDLSQPQNTPKAELINA